MIDWSKPRSEIEIVDTALDGDGLRTLPLRLFIPKVNEESPVIVFFAWYVFQQRKL